MTSPQTFVPFPPILRDTRVRDVLSLALGLVARTCVHASLNEALADNVSGSTWHVVIQLCLAVFSHTIAQSLVPHFVVSLVVLLAFVTSFAPVVPLLRSGHFGVTVARLFEGESSVQTLALVLVALVLVAIVLRRTSREWFRFKCVALDWVLFSYFVPFSGLYDVYLGGAKPGEPLLFFVFLGYWIGSNILAFATLRLAQKLVLGFPDPERRRAMKLVAGEPVPEYADHLVMSNGFTLPNDEILTRYPTLQIVVGAVTCLLALIGIIVVRSDFLSPPFMSLVGRPPLTCACAFAANLALYFAPIRVGGGRTNGATN